MPIYEYRCQQCRAITALFVRAIGAGGDTATPACDQCGSADTQRMMSAFAMGKTVAGVHAANPLDGSSGGSREFYSDPRNIGRNVEQSFARHGVEMPASVRESIDAARSGETPKGIDL